MGITGRLRALSLGALAVSLVAYLATFLHASPDYSVWQDGVLGNLVLVLPAVVCFGRVLLVPAQRVVFTLIGLAVSAFAAGNIVYVAHVQFLDPVPYPSWADIGYLTPYPLLLVSIVLLAVPELRGLPFGTWLDGLLSALAVAAAGSIIVVHRVLPEVSGSLFARVVAAAFPFSDLIVVALIVGVVTLAGGRPSSTWLWLGSGAVVFAVADSLYLYRVAEDTYSVGTPLDALWAIGLNLLVVSAVLPYRPGGRRTAPTPRALLLPNVFSLVAVALLTYGSLSDSKLPIYAVVLILATLVTAVYRTAVGYRALDALAASRHQARTDELTQLPNRRHFDEQVQAVLNDRPLTESLALVMLDLDGFKAINDTFGHHAGDELLRQIGPRLRRELREGDVVARLGGDEFGFLLRNADAEHATQVALRLVAAVAEPILLEQTRQHTAASAGIALCPEHGVDMAGLLREADVAMFDAKGRELPVVVFDPALHTLEERLDVRQALEEHEFVVVYQPQFEAATRALIGVEALVRWQHPTRGLIFPDQFLSLVEQAGLTGELTLEVLRIGAQDRRLWALAGLDVQLSVNLSPSALLDEGLPAAIDAVLVRQGLAARDLTLEVTESALLVDVERSVRTLTGLRDLGTHLSLDDYGTGYCSLTYLRDLPLDEVKIDRSFVMTLTPGTANADIVASTVGLGHALGLSVVAEGVETEIGLETLRAVGCDIVQGYLLGRPMPAQAILALPRPHLSVAADKMEQ